MKKVILCSLITISVAFGVDCNAMVKHNKPTKLINSCIDNNNADACYCASSVLSVAALELEKTGDYNKANKYGELAILLTKRACQLGNREVCAILDEAGMRR